MYYLSYDQKQPFEIIIIWKIVRLILMHDYLSLYWQSLLLQFLQNDSLNFVVFDLVSGTNAWCLWAKVLTVVFFQVSTIIGKSDKSGFKYQPNLHFFTAIYFRIFNSLSTRRVIHCPIKYMWTHLAIATLIL